MKWGFYFLLVSCALTTSLAPGAETGGQLAGQAGTQQADVDPDATPGLLGEWWTEAIAPRTRGTAVLSPIDSPDGYEPEVGGDPVSVPYYCGYWDDCDPSMGAPNYNAPWPQQQVGGAKALRRVRAVGDYGAYSGASQDEAALLRLGGSGDAEFTQRRPPDPAKPRDIIDLIRLRH